MNSSIISGLMTEFVRYNTGIDLKPLRKYLNAAEYDHGALKQTKNHHLHKVEELKPMFSIIQECLDDYKEKYQYDCERIKPSISWVNISSEFEAHPEHSHPNSLISGILYLNTTSPTIFCSPSVKTMGGSVFVKSNQIKYFENEAIEGNLVLFPSDVYHFTTFGMKRETLSFNTMPVGVTNKGTLMEHTYHDN